MVRGCTQCAIYNGGVEISEEGLARFFSFTIRGLAAIPSRTQSVCRCTEGSEYVDMTS
jgi:hypothetical protein